MSYIRTGRRGYGLGQTFTQNTFPTPISRSSDPVMQPTGSIPTQTMMQTNPLLSPQEYEQGDLAMKLEMQARSGVDPGAFEQPLLQASVPSRTAPTMLPVQPIDSGYGPTPTTAPASPEVGCNTAKIATFTDSEIIALVIPFFQALKNGQQPSRDLHEVIGCVSMAGKGYLVDKAEQIVISGGSGIQPSIAQVAQPAAMIQAIGPAVTEPMPSHPVIAQSRPTEAITQFVPEAGIYPAQQERPISVQQTPPPSSYEPSIAPITQRGNPPAGPIPDGPPSTAQVPMGPDSTASIPQGTLPPTNYTGGQTAYTASATQVATQAAVQPAQKSNIVPIAIAAGAVLLLSRLL